MSKEKSNFEDNKSESILYTIWKYTLGPIFILIAFILTVLIYAPLRYWIRKLANLILHLHRNKNEESDETPKDEGSKDNFMIRTLKFIVETHEYKGNFGTFLYLQKYIMGETRQARKNRVFAYFLLPSLTSFIVFVIIPFGMGIFYSFTDSDFLSKDYNMVGFSNYVAIFKNYDFVYSFYRTVQYTILSVLLINLVAFGLALLVTRKLKLKNIYRAGFFMPNLIGGLILGYIWQFIYNKTIPSLIAATTDKATLAYKLTHILNAQLDASVVLGGLITVVIWQYAGYIMMIYIAALQNVPQDLIEASKIDGANAWQRLKTITLPLVAQAFTVSIFLTMATSFKQFDTVYALTNGAPSRLIPDFIANWYGVDPSFTNVKSLNLMALDIYSTGYVVKNLAVAQAKAVIFFLFLLFVSIFQVTYNKRREVEL